MPASVAHKQYEVLRMYYLDGAPAHQVAPRFGYTYRAFTSPVTLFRHKVLMNPRDRFFFIENFPGRKVFAQTNDAKSLIINIRKKYYSVPAIKVAQDGLGHALSEKNIYNILAAEGFSRLPRRSKLVKQQSDPVQVEAEKSIPQRFTDEIFYCSNAGILIFLALKLANRRRGKLLLERIDNLPATGWKNIRAECAGNKHLY